MININLVSEGKKPVVARQAKTPALGLGDQDLGQWCVVLGILPGLVIAGVWWYMLNGTVQANNADIRVAEKTVAELQEIIDEVERFERKETELEHKIEVITNLKNNQTGPVRMMDEISKALPELVWLEGFNMQSSQISLKGRAFNHNAVANFITNLDEVPAFEEPELRDVVKRGNVYTFAIDFKYSSGPLKSPGTVTASGL